MFLAHLLYVLCGVLRGKQSVKLLLKSCVIIVSLEISVDRKRDNSALLGDHDNHSVAYLGKTYSRSVASSEILIYIGLSRER